MYPRAAAGRLIELNDIYVPDDAKSNLEAEIWKAGEVPSAKALTVLNECMMNGFFLVRSTRANEKTI